MGVRKIGDKCWEKRFQVPLPQIVKYYYSVFQIFIEKRIYNETNKATKRGTGRKK